MDLLWSKLWPVLVPLVLFVLVVFVAAWIIKKWNTFG